MLRRSRTFVVMFFILAVAIFVGYRFFRIMTTDRTMPVIEMDSESITVSVEGGDEAILEGVTATDKKDGDITENLFIESRTNFFDKGRFNVTIAVVDKDNHVVKTTREVTYSDYISPQFSLSGPLKFQIQSERNDSLDIAGGLGARDVIEGNISNRIKISRDYTIVAYTAGDYHMEFIVSNNMGDTVNFPVTVTLYNAAQESNLPKIQLSSYLINTPVGSEVDLGTLLQQVTYHGIIYTRSDDGTLYSDRYDGEGNILTFPSDYVQVDDNVDWSTPGVYEVVIKVIDNSNGLSNTARCYINVY